MPLALVCTVAGDAGLMLPPPPVTVNVTETPATGLSNWSRTITDGAVVTAVFTVAVWLLPAFTAIWVAPPAVAVAVKPTGLPARPPDVACSVFAPGDVP